MSQSDDRDHYEYGDYADDYSEYMADLYEEHKKEALTDFTRARLQSYFVANQLLLKEPLGMLGIAQQQRAENASVAHVFAASATEISIKTLFLRPVVFGLVHSESTAGLVSELVIKFNHLDQLRDLLFQILRDHGRIDLRTATRTGENRTLWEEILEVRKERNNVLHRGILMDQERADRSIAVASELIEMAFPALVKELGLHIHEDLRVCGDEDCRFENPEFA